MAEIAITDLSSATMARFGNDNDVAQAALDAVLVAARHHCRWHVSPVRSDDEITLDGPSVSVLDLPTRKLNDLTSVVELGASLDVTKLDWATDGPHGAPVRKQSGACWSNRYRSIVVTMDHGFTEAEAADWRRAIVSMVDSISYLYVGSGGNAGLKVKKVDDIQYEWFDFASAADKAVYSVESVLDAYRIHEVMFA